MSKVHSNQSIKCLEWMEEKEVRIKIFKKSKSIYWLFTTTDDVYENLEDYNPAKKGKVLIVFDDMIPGMKTNEKLSPVVTELF